MRTSRLQAMPFILMLFNALSLYHLFFDGLKPGRLTKGDRMTIPFFLCQIDFILLDNSWRLINIIQNVIRNYQTYVLSLCCSSFCSHTQHLTKNIWSNLGQRWSPDQDLTDVICIIFSKKYIVK